MVYFNIKEQLIYYVNEPDLKIRQRYYATVLYDILNTLFSFSLKKCHVFESSTCYEDIRQDLHIHVILNIEKIIKAKDSNAYLLTISKNFILNSLEWQTKNFIPLQNGEICEPISYQ